MLAKFRQKWNITTDKDFILIMLAFSLAGMGICVVRPIEFHLLHLEHAPIWTKIVIYPFLVIPSYYVGLLVFGALLGQFDFAKRFALNSLQRIGRLWGRLTTNTASSK